MPKVNKQTQPANPPKAPPAPAQQQELPWLTIEQVAKRLQLSLNGVRSLWRTKKMPAPVRLGRRTLRWRRSEIDAWERNADPNRAA